MTTSYRLAANNNLSQHYTHQSVWLVRDGNANDEPSALERLMSNRGHELHVYVKSGEYFTTLATILDGISDHPELQQIVHDLIYLQQHYKIVKK